MARRGTHHGKPLLSNHQKSWLWGTVPVWETLQAGRWPIYELVLADSADQVIHQECTKLALQQGISVRKEPVGRLEQLCKSRDHQGLLALMGPFPYASLEQFLNRQPAQVSRSASLLVILDRIQDPFNMGAIIRSAAAFGAAGIMIGQHNQVAVNSHVARSSAGAVNHIPIFETQDLAETLHTLKQTGYHPFAAAMHGTIAVHQVRQDDRYREAPLALIIGNEATGVDPLLLQLCTETVSIPMSGSVESLNAAVAAGILLFNLTLNQ